MMRGSTELLDKDYKIHIPAVKVILKHCKLFGKDLLNNQTNVKELFDLEAELRASYVTGKEGGLKKVSDTLSTKIIMGTLGIVPAYDTQVINSLKKYGKRAYGYLNILEEEVEKVGTTVSEAIQKEHFDIAIRKISMSNCITSIKMIQRINFLDIFEKITA